MVYNTLRTVKRLLFPGRSRSAVAQAKELERLRVRVIELESAFHQQSAQFRSVAVNTILQAAPEAFFACQFNGVHVFLPRDTLRTMTHCLHARPDGPFMVEVERAHAEWLLRKLRPGDTFLDVGAATGAMSLPFALSIPDLRVIAFEPCRTANQRLRETLQRNGATGVDVQDFAVSDACGSAVFAELQFDPTGQTPWLPEASTIASGVIDSPHRAATYEVPTITLDAFFASRSDEMLVRCVKIDVEGFEIHVLRGGANFVRRVRPYLAIDIHRNPFGEGTTEQGVRACLEPIGYRFEKMAHVLLCNPPAPHS